MKTTKKPIIEPEYQEFSFKNYTVAIEENQNGIIIDVYKDNKDDTELVDSFTYWND